MAKALVIGLGSIGRRHVQVLTDIGCTVATVSRHAPKSDGYVFSDVDSAIGRFKPDYIVVANETSAHVPTLIQVRAGGHRGPVLVEKPLRNTQGTTAADAETENIFVGYNMRFHPVILALRERIADRRVILADFHCGSFLPDWRPDTDYRTASSASLRAGGGVLHDLSHEIDYALWLLGDWRSLAAINGRLGQLEIETDDVALILMEAARCPAVTIRLNYLDRRTVRQVRIVTDTESLLGDLVTGELYSHESLVFRRNTERNDTYAAMHRSILAGKHETCCSFAEAERVSKVLEAVQQSARQRSRVSP